MFILLKGLSSGWEQGPEPSFCHSPCLWVDHGVRGIAVSQVLIPPFTPACWKCFNFTDQRCERSRGGLELFSIGFLSLFPHPFNGCSRLHLWRLIYRRFPWFSWKCLIFPVARHLNVFCCCWGDEGFVVPAQTQENGLHFTFIYPNINSINYKGVDSFFPLLQSERDLTALFSSGENLILRGNILMPLLYLRPKSRTDWIS